MKTLALVFMRRVVPAACLFLVPWARASDLAEGVGEREYNAAGVALNDLLLELGLCLEENSSLPEVLHPEFSGWRPGLRPAPGDDSPEGLYW